MDLELTKVSIASVAELMQKKPQKLRSRFEKVGMAIPEDGILDLDDVQLGLLMIDEDWDEIIGPIKTVPVDAATVQRDRKPRLYADLAEIELEQAAESLVSPSDPDKIRRLAKFLDANDESEVAARLLSGAYIALTTDAISADSTFESECKTDYATNRAKALLKEGDYRYAAEMAFAALACGTELGFLQRNDERVILYFLAILLDEGVISDPSWRDYTVEELILVGFDAGQIKTIDRLRQAVRRVLYFYEDFVEHLKLSRDVRVTLRKNFDFLKDDLNLDPDLRGIDLYSQLAADITQPIRSLESTGEAFLSAEGYTGITQYRSRLIPRIKDIRRFAIPEELEAIDGLVEFLSRPLTELGKQRESGSVREYGQAHTHLLEMSYNLEQQIETRPSWLSACFIFPILRWVRECLVVDFQDRTSAYTTAVSLSLSKREYPLKTGKVQTLTIVARNEGNSLAEDVAVDFRSTSDIDLSPDMFEVGHLAIGATSGEHTLEVKVLRERAVYEIPYTLSWGHLTGEKTTLSDSLKLLPQRQIDWEEYRSNPYSISSIKEDQPERLKGRADKLMALRMGLDNMLSFFITGQKRVGKSSIANVYYGELLKQEGVLPVHFLWGDVADCDLPMLGEAMCQFVEDAWQDKTKSNLPFSKPAIESFRKSFSRTFSEYLRSFHRTFPTWKLIFVIDDFDEIREELYKGETGDAFFTTLRAFIDRDFTSFIVVGSENLSATILREQGRKVNQADVLEVDHLDSRKDLEELVTEPAKEILAFDQEAVSAIIDLAAGNPYYTNLLCSRIYRLMFDERDYYVSRSDVTKAAGLLAREDKEKSYNHYWTDGIRDTGAEKDRISYNNAMTLIAISKSDADARGYVDIRTIYQQPEVHYLETAELEYRLNELADRKVIERDPSSPNRFRIKVRVFDLWLQSGGAHQIRQSFGQYVYTVRPLKDHALFPEEITQVADGLEYRGENIDRILVETWLRQFGDEYTQRLAYKVLCALKERGYYSIARFNSALETMFKKAIASVTSWMKVVDKKLTRNVLVCHIDPVGKSGSALVTEFRRVNQIYHRLCGSLEEIAEILAGKSELSQQVKPNERWLLMMVDDFVGSGNSGSEYIVKALETLDQESPGWDFRCYPFYAFVCGFEKGAELIEAASNNRVKVIITNPLEEKDRAFSPEAGIFQDERERTIAKALFQKIGFSLEKRHPLGHEGSEALIVFPQNVPNNTLPVFYKRGRYEGKLWTPLFPRV